MCVSVCMCVFMCVYVCVCIYDIVYMQISENNIGKFFPSNILISPWIQLKES